MANTAPIARLTANKTEITLPDNEIILDASGSTDANANAVLSYRHYQKSGPGGITITNPNSPLAKVNITQAGDYEMEVEVIDRGLLKSTATVSFKVNPEVMSIIKFGAILVGGTYDENVNVAKQLGIHILRTTATLDNWRGKDLAVDRYISEGFKVLLNINYKAGGPNPFYKDLVNYRKLVEQVLIKYKPEVAVIENEATTDLFHSGPIEDYIALLKVGVEVCHQYGVKVTDSGMNTSFISQIMSGRSSTGNVSDTKKMIEAFKTIPLDFINIHSQFSGSSYDVGGLKKVTDWLRNETGKAVMANEWHVSTASISLMKDVIAAWKASDVAYSVIYSGSSASNHNSPVSIKTTLTDIGRAFRDAIKY